MKRKMAMIDGCGAVKCVEGEIPELKDREVLIEVYASLISPGTEMAGAKGRRANPDPKADPLYFGYSNAGVILKTCGDVRNLKPGMRVAAMGGGYAAHASYTCAPVNMVVPLPDNVSFEEGCFLSLAATSLQAVRRTGTDLGEYGVVLGQGIVGNLASQLFRLSGCRVQGWETLPLRTEISHKCGNADIIDFMKCDAVEEAKKFAAPYGLDFALFAFGGNAETAFMNIKKCMKVSADGHQMGRVTLVGGCRVPVDGGALSGNLDIRVSSRTGAGYHDNAWEYGKDYPAAFVQFTTMRNAVELIQLMSEKRLIIDPMITHRMPVEECGKAADLLIDHPDQALGVILTMR